MNQVFPMPRDCVQRLQAQLSNAGYPPAMSSRFGSARGDPAAWDGLFGPGTAHALAQFLSDGGSLHVEMINATRYHFRTPVNGYDSTVTTAFKPEQVRRDGYLQANVPDGHQCPRPLTIPIENITHMEPIKIPRYGSRPTA